MTDSEKLLQLCASLKALRAERDLQDDHTPHTNVMRMRSKANSIRGDIKTLADKIVSEINVPREKEAL